MLNAFKPHFATRQAVFKARYILALACVGVGFGELRLARGAELQSVEAFVKQHCVDCHNQDDKQAGLALDAILAEDDVVLHSQAWEKVVRRLRARQMPPSDVPRPAEREYEAALRSLEAELDTAATRQPRPGRTSTFRRLNRTEYQNAIRDLLALDINAAALLPADESSHGFDNVTVGNLSPTLLNRYISAAQKISRLAVGRSSDRPGGDTIRIRADLTQEAHVPGLPIGTRGGTLIPYTFPVAGEYEIQIRLARDRNEHVEGLNATHQLEVLLDRKRVGLLTVKPPRKPEDHQTADAHLKIRLRAAGGPAELGVTFLKKPFSLLETKRQPYQAHFNMHRHPRVSPAVYQVSITGPYSAAGAGETPSRRRIFVCRPASPDREEACAKQILATMMRRAYRRPVTEADLRKPMQLYREGREAGDFEAGIEMGLSAVLVNPRFVFRIESDPEALPSNTPYRISDVELASRLSFFLWSSIPDDELLGVAERGELSNPEVIEQQVRRMLQDERSRSLASNFAGQWLYLRNLESFTPDMRLFPGFDDNLRQAMRRETELFFESIVREDRSVLDLLQADYTFLNERLAKHYDIPHVYGSRFRRVSLDDHSHRGGLFRHASILTVTSYATRTSPVLRGNWILKNILGTPPPPPPDNVPALKDNTVSATLSVRERLAEHRANPSCAGCHDLMDPVGFALENYDAIGRWRDAEAGESVNAAGGLPDGSQFVGVTGLEQGLLARPEIVAGTIVEKLLTFALGRGVGHDDAPAVRKILRAAAEDDYRLSSLVIGIAQSTPLQMRTTE